MSAAKNIEDLIASVRGTPLAKREAWLREVVRPAVEILPFAPDEPHGRSHYGGAPDLAPGTSWPTHAGGPYFL